MSIFCFNDCSENDPKDQENNCIDSKALILQDDLWCELKTIEQQFVAKSSRLSSEHDDFSPHVSAASSFDNISVQSKYEIDYKSEINLPNLENDETCLSTVVGLNDVKNALKNILVYPALYPQMFPDNTGFWNKILLYGPPGTGKTMIAESIANEMDALFINVSSADILSHWFGATERKIKNLFDHVVSTDKLTVMFFDEMDRFGRNRTDKEQDSERRLKTELLVQLEKLNSGSNVYIIAATNCPWDIDPAFLRRFNQKVYVPLPDKLDRITMLKKWVEKSTNDLTDREWEELGDLTKGYSGSDLKNVAMLTFCERLHSMMACTRWVIEDNDWIPAIENNIFFIKKKFSDIPSYKVKPRQLTVNDFKLAVQKTSKSVPASLVKRFQQFKN